METFIPAEDILARIKIHKSKNKADQFKFELGILGTKYRTNENRKNNGVPDTNPSDSLRTSNKK